MFSKSLNLSDQLAWYHHTVLAEGRTRRAQVYRFCSLPHDVSLIAPQCHHSALMYAMSHRTTVSYQWVSLRKLRLSCINPFIQSHTNGLVQERRNSSALAMELCLSCINPSMQSHTNGLVQEKRNSSAIAMELHLSYINALIQFVQQLGNVSHYSLKCYSLL